MSKPRLAIVIGSVRPNRFADHPAQWITEIARKRGDFEVELIDLKDYPMPLFDEKASPAYAPSESDVARRWQKKMAEFDAYVFTAAEYNRGPTAVLKNALDYAYKEWNQKPVSFVGYGGVGGAGDRAAAAERHRAADGADPQCGPHPVAGLSGREPRKARSWASSISCSRAPGTCWTSWPGGRSR
jgi:NAD(P)H-dependent FMN reductase